MQTKDIRNAMLTSLSLGLRQAKERLEQVEAERAELEHLIKEFEALPAVFKQEVFDQVENSAITIRDVIRDTLQKSDEPVRIAALADEVRARNIPTTAKNLDRSIEATLAHMRKEEPITKVGVGLWQWNNIPTWDNSRKLSPNVQASA